jgi:ribosomal protein S18 acetylase RimI-like enzyme
MAFDGYFVKMPDSLDYWATRFKQARVNYHYSFGVFDASRLVAFIIQGMDIHDGQLTAFNTGTGVLPAYRGQKLVDRLYDHAIPRLKERGIQKCQLEVIQENERAIRVY